MLYFTPHTHALSPTEAKLQSRVSLPVTPLLKVGPPQGYLWFSLDSVKLHRSQSGAESVSFYSLL